MTDQDYINMELARINNLIATKNIEIALANRELSLGGWLSDHTESAVQIDREIEFHFENLARL